jgi:hypothetical protein
MGSRLIPRQLSTGNLLLWVAVPLLFILAGLGLALFSDANGYIVGAAALVCMWPALLIVLSRYPDVVIGVYGADLLKVLLVTLPLLLGRPRLWDSYLDSAELIAGAAVVMALLLAFVQRKAQWTLWLIAVPVLCQVGITVLRFFSLLQSPDGLSIQLFFQFVAGNMLLLLAPIALCKNPRQVRRVWQVWTIAAIILALASVWLLSQGVLARSARQDYLLLAQTKTGRVCATTMIFLVLAVPGQSLRSLKGMLRLLAIVLCAVAILTSGSKATFVWLLAVMGVYVVIGPTAFPKLRQALGLVLIGLAIVFFLLVGLPELDPLRKLTDFSWSIAGRMQNAQYFVSRALSSPVFGHGIVAAYEGETAHRTHNILVELFVQVGILGPVLLFAFLASICVYGWRAIKATAGDQSTQRLVIATFLACLHSALMAQVTSDIVGNRDLWLFSGMLTALYFQTLQKPKVAVPGPPHMVGRRSGQP